MLLRLLHFNGFIQISNWLEEEFDAAPETYEEKLVQIKTLTGPLYSRVREHEERPDALSALKSAINGSEHFLQYVKTKTKEALDKGDETIFTEVELNTLEKVIKETQVSVSIEFLGKKRSFSVELIISCDFFSLQN